MRDRNSLEPAFIAIVAGMVLWFVAGYFMNAREPWDDPIYWRTAYPTALLVAALLGYCYPERAWRWALALFAAQFVAMTIRNGEIGSLWPLGLVVFGVIGLPAVVLAQVAARFSRRSASR